jgi:hypothetical protein
MTYMDVGNSETILTLAACHFVVHEKRGFDQVRLVIEADPVNLLKIRLCRHCPNSRFYVRVNNFRFARNPSTTQKSGKSCVRTVWGVRWRFFTNCYFCSSVRA